MLKISNIEYIGLKKFELIKEVGEHSFCSFRVFIDSGKFDECISKLNSDIEIKYNDDIIFNGYIYELELENIKNHLYLKIKAYSHSKKEDIIPYTRVFQDTKKTYKDILNDLKLKPVKGIILDSSVENKVIKLPVIQFEETNYQFLKRIFSNENTEVINDDISNNNQRIFFGKRENQSHDIKEYSNYSIKRNSENFMFMLTLPFNVLFSIGDFIKIEKKKYWIIKNKTLLRNGILYSEIEATEFKKYKINKIKFKVLPELFKAKVIVNKDDKNLARIQVEFDKKQIEDINKAKNRYWFTVNTPYATKDVGFHFIPAVNDSVLINLANFNVVSAIRENSNGVFTNPQEQYIRNEFKKEFNLKEKELNLISHDKISLKMTEEFIELKNGNSLIKIEKNNIIIKVDGGDVNIKGSKVKIN